VSSSKILEKLSLPLRSELLYELFHGNLVVCPFFKEMQERSRAFGRKICEVALTEFALSEFDVLFNAGTTAAAMYVLTRGEMLYTRSGSHIVQPWLSGSYCSEPALWTRWIHLGSMKAFADSEGVHVRTEDFRSVVLAFPAIHDFARRYADSLVSGLNVQCSVGVLDGTDVTDMSEPCGLDSSF